MALEQFANFPAAQVISGGTTAPAPGTVETWTVSSSAEFPAASATLVPATQFHVGDPAASSEVVLVTSVSGTTWTVTRGDGNTAPVAHAAGFTVVQVVSAGAFAALATPQDWLNVITGFGAQGDIRDLSAVAITSSSHTLTCAGGNFTAADAGKVAYVYGAGAAGAQLVTTVSAVTNSTTVTLAAAASTTVSSGTAFIGTDDTAAWQAALAAVPSGGGTVYLPAGYRSYVSSTLSATVSGTIIKSGGQGGQIRYPGSVAGTLLNASTTRFTIFVRDIRLSQVDPVAAGTCIDISNWSSGAIERTRIDAGGSGAPPLICIDANSVNCHYNAVRDCKLTYGGTGGIGIRFEGQANSNTVDDCKLASGTGADASSCGIYITNAHSNTLIHPDVESAAGYGIFLDTGADATTIVNPYLEANNVNLKVSSGVNCPVVIGGTNQTAVTANLQDNGSVNPVYLVTWENSGSSVIFALPPNGGPEPADQNLISWSYDPAVPGSSSTVTAGQVQLVRQVVRSQGTVSSILLHVATAGSGLTSSQNRAGLYNAAGALLSGTADQTASWGSTGLKTIPLGTVQAIQPGTYYAGFVANGGTTPAFARGGALTAESALLNAGLTASAARFAVSGTAVTALGTISMASNSLATVGFWAALS